MDYTLEYHKELERKVTMLFDNVSKVSDKADEAKTEALAVKQRINYLTMLTVLLVILTIPQSIPYFEILIRLMFGV
jgi:translation initiation factor 2 beta subunit (eIF-2beta)/eIF-5